MEKKSKMWYMWVIVGPMLLGYAMGTLLAGFVFWIHVIEPMICRLTHREHHTIVGHDIRTYIGYPNVPCSEPVDIIRCSKCGHKYERVASNIFTCD